MRTVEFAPKLGRDDVRCFGYLHERVPATGPRPAIVVCPGGGFHVVSRAGTEGDPTALSFFADGYDAFVLEYSVSSRAPEGASALPAPVADLARTLDAIVENASEWGIDPDAICIAGFSAGGLVAGLYATCWHEPWLAEAAGLKHCVRPAAALLVYAVLDYELYAHRMTPADLRAVFGTEDLDAETSWHSSPVHLVSESTPPSFVTAAFDDAVVDPVQSIRFAEELSACGIPCELHLFELGNHAYGPGLGLEAPWRSDQALSCGAWVDLAKTFLLHQLHPETKQNQSTPFGR